MVSKFLKLINNFRKEKIQNIPEPEYSHISQPFGNTQDFDFSKSTYYISKEYPSDFIKTIFFPYNYNFLEKILYTGRLWKNFLDDDDNDSLRELNYYNKRARSSLFLVKGKEGTYVSYALVELAFLLISNKFNLPIKEKEDGFFINR